MRACAHCHLLATRENTLPLPSIRFVDARCHHAPLVSDDELADSNFLRDGRNDAFKRAVPYRGMLEYLTDLYRDYRGEFFDRVSGNAVYLDMTPLEDAPVYWFRDLAAPCPDHVRPRVRSAARERWRVALTILRATADNGAYWGAIANDHAPT